MNDLREAQATAEECLVASHEAVLREKPLCPADDRACQGGLPQELPRLGPGRAQTTVAGPSPATMHSSLLSGLSAAAMSRLLDRSLHQGHAGKRPQVHNHRSEYVKTDIPGLSRGELARASKTPGPPRNCHECQLSCHLTGALCGRTITVPGRAEGASPDGARQVRGRTGGTGRHMAPGRADGRAGRGDAPWCAGRASGSRP